MLGGTVGGDAGGRMDRIMVAEAIGLGLSYAFGATVSIITMIAMAIRREDKQATLTRQPPDPAARGVRRLTGLGLRDIMPPDPRQVRR
jgi:hypothetical protein